MAPTQAEFFKEQFGGEFLYKTFANDNTDLTFIFKSGNVTILVKEELTSTELVLGDSKPNVYETGDVQSKKQRISFHRPSKYVEDIYEARRELLEEHLGSSTDLYEAWVNEFGKSSIITDDR